MMRLPGGVLAALGSIPESEYLPFLTDAECFFASVLDDEGDAADSVRYLIDLATIIDQVINEGRYHFSSVELSLFERKQLRAAVSRIRELLLDPSFSPDLAGIEQFAGDRSAGRIREEMGIFLEILEERIAEFDRVSLPQWLRYWDASRIDDDSDAALVVFRADDLPELVQLTPPEEFGVHAQFDDAGRLVRLEHYAGGEPSREYLVIAPDEQSAQEVTGMEKEQDTNDPSVSDADYAVYYYDWIVDRIEQFCKRYEDKPFRCSFCEKSQQEVAKLIAGPTVMICNECVAFCNDILEEEDV